MSPWRIGPLIITKFSSLSLQYSCLAFVAVSFVYVTVWWSPFIGKLKWSDTFYLMCLARDKCLLNICEIKISKWPEVQTVLISFCVVLRNKQRKVLQKRIPREVDKCRFRKLPFFFHRGIESILNTKIISVIIEDWVIFLISIIKQTMRMVMCFKNSPCIRDYFS